jgi:hypothetical protein
VRADSQQLTINARLRLPIRLLAATRRCFFSSAAMTFKHLTIKARIIATLVPSTGAMLIVGALGVSWS